MIGRLYGLSRHDAQARTEQVLDRIHLADAADRQVKTYSGGMRRRIDLAAPDRPPQVMFLDRPPPASTRPAAKTSGSSSVIWPPKATVLLTTQYLDEADQLANRIAVIDHGRLITEHRDRTQRPHWQRRRRTGSPRRAAEATLRDHWPRSSPPTATGSCTPQTAAHPPAGTSAARRGRHHPHRCGLHRPTLDDMFMP
jgi:ABC-type multidrug transport system ATPase subunit